MFNRTKSEIPIIKSGHRLFKELRQLTHAERLYVLGLWSLEERRNRADFVEVYKMIRPVSYTYQQPNFLNLTKIVEPEVTNLN